MFGYVLPVRCEMKVRDFETYRSLYCGVCKQLGKSYGTASRFLLNYDLVLLAVVADALSGDRGTTRQEGCFANPLGKAAILHQTAGLTLASDGLILLSHHKLVDNLQDEAFVRRIPYSVAKPFSTMLYRRAAAKYPQLDTLLSNEMQRQQELERAKSASLDRASEPTARMCEALFAQAAQTEGQKRILGRLGLFAGQIVYLLDAADDFESDQKHGRYNPLLLAGYSKQEAIHAVQRRCRMAAGEIALCYNLLEIKQHKDILDNIFFLGLPAGIAAAGVKQTKRRPKHGQIDSI